MKKWAIGGVGVLGLGLGALLVLPAFVDVNAYKEPALQKIESATGYRIVIEGSVELAVLPWPRITAQGVRVATASQADPFLTLGSAGVDIALWPLLGGRIVADSVRLNDLVLDLRVDAQGVGNWSADKPRAESSGNGSDPARLPVSLNDIRISNGTVRYQDARSGKAYALGNVQAALSADSVQGPFSGKGDLVWSGHKLAFEASTGRLGESGTTPVRVDISAPAAKASLRYAGALGLGAAPDIQGELRLVSENVPAAFRAWGILPQGGVALPESKGEVQGILTLSGRQASLRNLKVDYGDMSFAGKILLALQDADAKKKTPESVSIEADITAVNPVAWDLLVPVSRRGGSDVKNTKEPARFLPEALTLPLPVTGQIAFRAPAIIRGTRRLTDVEATLTATGNRFDGTLSAGGLPSGGRLTAGGTLSYRESRLGEQGTILSAPTLTFEGNLVEARPAALRDFFWQEGWGQPPALPKALTPLDARFKIGVTPAKITVSDTLVTFDSTKLGVDGTYALPSKSGERAQARVKLIADSFDLDRYRTESPAAVPSATPLAPLLDGVTELSLPFDLAFDFGASVLEIGTDALKDVVLKGALRDRRLELETLAVGGVYGANVLLSGHIGDTKGLQDIALTLKGSARDAEAILGRLGVDIAAFPKPFGAGQIEAHVSGHAESLAFDAIVSALKGRVEARGQVTGLRGQPALNGLSLAVNHPDFSEALRVFKPDFPRRTGRPAPLDMKATLVRKDQIYHISDLSGHVGPTAVEGTLRVQTGGVRPVISGTLQLGDFSRADFLPAPAPAPASESRWSRTALSTDWLRSADVELDVALRKLVWDRWVLESPAFQVRMKDGTLRVPALNAGLYGGTLAASASLSARSDARKPLAIEAQVQATDVDVTPLVRALTGGTPIKARGQVSLDTKIKAAGVSQAALIFDLSGEGVLRGQDLVLEGVDFEEFAVALSGGSRPGATISGLWQGATRGGETRFETLDGAYGIEEGLVTLRHMVLDGARGRVDTTGTISLPRWHADLSSRITLPQREDIPPFDIRFSGPLDNPASTFARGLLDDYLERQLTRKLESLLMDKKKPAPEAGDPESGSDTQTDSPPDSDPPPEDAPRPTAPRPEDMLRGLLQEMIR